MKPKNVYEKRALEVLRMCAQRDCEKCMFYRIDSGVECREALICTADMILNAGEDANESV